MTDQTTETDVIEADLCHANYGNGDTYPRSDEEYRNTGIPADYYTCASSADGVTSWPCTGSKHLGSTLVRCSCSCHRFVVLPPAPEGGEH